MQLHICLWINLQCSSLSISYELIPREENQKGNLWFLSFQQMWGRWLEAMGSPVKFSCVWRIVSSHVLTWWEEAPHPPLCGDQWLMRLTLGGRGVSVENERGPAWLGKRNRWHQESSGSLPPPSTLRRRCQEAAPSPELQLKWTCFGAYLWHSGWSPASPLLSGIWNLSSTS